MNGSVIELFVSIRSIAGSGLAEFAEHAKKSFDKVQNYIVNTTKKLDALISRFQTLNNELPGLGETMKQTFEDSGISDAVDDMEELHQAAQRAAGAIANIPATPAVGAIANIPAAPAAGAAVGGNAAHGNGPGRFAGQARAWALQAVNGLRDLVTESMDMAREYNAARNNVIGLAHNAVEGEKLASGLDDMAEHTVLGRGVFKTAADLQVQGGGNGKVLPLIQAFGDISGGDAGKMADLTGAYGAVQASGKLDEKSLEQFRTGHFDPIKQISESMNMDEGAVMKKFREGAIGIDMIDVALKDATKSGGEFYDGLNLAAESPAAKMQLLQQWVDTLRIKLGQALLPILDSMGALAGFLLDNKELIIAVAAAWGVYTLIAERAVLSQVAMAIATEGVAIATELWNAIMMINPIALIIALVVGLIVWITALTRKYEGWGIMLEGLWEIIKGFVKSVILDFRDFYEGIVYYLSRAWLGMQDFGQRAIQFARNVAQAIRLALTGHGDEARELLTARIKTEAETRIEELEKNRKNYLDESGKDRAAALLQIGNGFAKLDNGWDKRGVLKPESKGAASVSAGGITDSNTMTFKPTDTAKDVGREVGKDVTSGGPRVININGVRFADKIEIHVNALEEGLSQLEDRMGQLYLRILNSGAKMQ
ncbi:uncharacterized protein YoxC [Filimonas zeae]|uniref:Tape measure domain-containing protein n=1 Tax=Filimonas zeae TaxID=1737353 RepID=A0A917J4N6_9BACT|nr:hypothetical protein [Filimonas zeae]MDR6340867.1 uncharacterized protein YoxC [Filimonas zeae]GGH78141.1 hypothetical protein GCM10011379_45570 [Filimonas zeae]